MILKKEVCSIYLLINLVNKKVYVGQTWNKNLKDRMGRNGYGYSNSIKIFNAIKYYGVDNFEYSLLEIAFNQKDADIIENYWINFFNSKELGYNIKDGGSNGKHSLETIEKIRRTMLGKGPLSKETRDKISKAGKGVKKKAASKDRKDKYSTFMKKWHADNTHPMLGKNHSSEIKNRISLKLIGKKRSPESVRKGALKLIKIDKERDDEIIRMYKNSSIKMQEILEKFDCSLVYRVLYRNNIPLRGPLKNNGKKHSEETKAKMSASMKQAVIDRKNSELIQTNFLEEKSRKSKVDPKSIENIYFLYFSGASKNEMMKSHRGSKINRVLNKIGIFYKKDNKSRRKLSEQELKDAVLDAKKKFWGKHFDENK